MFSKRLWLVIATVMWSVACELPIISETSLPTDRQSDSSEVRVIPEGELYALQDLTEEILLLSQQNKIVFVEGDISDLSELSDDPTRRVVFRVNNFEDSNSLWNSVQTSVYRRMGAAAAQQMRSVRRQTLRATAKLVGDRLSGIDGWLMCRSGTDWGFFASRVWGNVEQNDGALFDEGEVRVKFEIYNQVRTISQLNFYMKKIEEDEWTIGLNVPSYSLYGSWHTGTYGGTTKILVLGNYY